MTEILIVDDEAGIRRSLAGLLSDEGFAPHEAADGEAALTHVQNAGPDLVLLDVAMPGRDGMAILEELRRRRAELPVIMMSGHGTIETAVRATQLGAFDFIEKPLDFQKLLVAIRNALRAAKLSAENRALRAQALRAKEIIGASAAVKKLKEQIAIAAPTPAGVLITGENGTGKELVAKRLHLQSRRSEGPFVEVNCAAIPEELIESELFGHERGAFTGARAQKRGKFELAHGGTIFLDEIADMSGDAQAKILRVLQERKLERVGGGESREVDVRVFAATNKNLEEEISAGNFREDLYYRLKVIPFHVPALRERAEDIPALAQTFMEEFCADAGARPKSIAPEALQQLQAYPWPGNVRELRNLMERLVLMTQSEIISAQDLPPEIHRRGAPKGGGTSTAAAAAAAGTLEEARKVFEKEFLSAKLQAHQGDVAAAAEALGIARESLYRKLKSHGIRKARGLQ